MYRRVHNWRRVRYDKLQVKIDLGMYDCVISQVAITSFKFKGSYFTSRRFVKHSTLDTNLVGTKCVPRQPAGFWLRVPYHWRLHGESQDQTTLKIQFIELQLRVWSLSTATVVKDRVASSPWNRQ